MHAYPPSPTLGRLRSERIASRGEFQDTRRAAPSFHAPTGGPGLAVEMRLCLLGATLRTGPTTPARLSVSLGPLPLPDPESLPEKIGGERHRRFGKLPGPVLGNGRGHRGLERGELGR